MKPEYKKPQFSWASPCAKCPTMGGPDPLSADMLTWPFKERMKEVFSCAWRNKGYCYANAKTTFYGSAEVIKNG